jgi:hypothetical protein
VPGHDEQGVVDPDAKADERAEDRRYAGHGRQVAERRHEHQAAAHARHRGRDRQRHREQRAEREEQDHRGGADADR